MVRQGLTYLASRCPTPDISGMSQSVRSLAAEADLTVRQCLHVLHQAGMRQLVGGQRLEGHDLSRARALLGLPLQHETTAPGTHRQMLDEDELLIRVLRPLRQKGKLGCTHTTPIEHLWGHGIPDHQKDQAKEITDALIAEGSLSEKICQKRRHVWLTTTGLARLAEAEQLQNKQVNE